MNDLRTIDAPGDAATTFDLYAWASDIAGAILHLEPDEWDSAYADGLKAQAGACIAEIEAKVRAIGALRQRFIAESELIKQNVQQLQAAKRRADANRAKMDELAKLALEALEQMGQKGSVRTPEGTVFVANRAPKVVYGESFDVTALDAGFQTVSVKANTAAIKAALQAGQKIDGAALEASRSVTWRQ